MDHEVNYRHCIIVTKTECEWVNVFLVPAQLGRPGWMAVKWIAVVLTVTRTRAKDVLPNKPHAGPEITPLGSNGMVPPSAVTSFAASAFHSVAAGGRWVMGVHSAFLSLVTLIFDFDIQTHPPEGPNTSSLWIWHKSVQRFWRYFTHKQTKQKSNRQR